MSAQTPQRPAIQHADDGTPVGMQYSSCPDCNAQELADALVEARKEIIRLKALCEELRADSERFRFLQNLPIVEAQQFFWNWKSRKQRAVAIDAALKKAQKDI